MVLLNDVGELGLESLMKKNEIQRQDNLRQHAEVAKLGSIFDLEVHF